MSQHPWQDVLRELVAKWRKAVVEYNSDTAAEKDKCMRLASYALATRARLCADELEAALSPPLASSPEQEQGERLQQIAKRVALWEYISGPDRQWLFEQVASLSTALQQAQEERDDREARWLNACGEWRTCERDLDDAKARAEAAESALQQMERERGK
jgi:hypothetical protein